MTGRKKIIWSVVGVVLLSVLATAGVIAEQWYRMEVCNYESRDGESH